MQKIELAATATTPSQSAQFFPSQTIPSTPLTKGTVIVSTAVSPENVGKFAAESIQAIKVDVVTMSQRQYLLIFTLLMYFNSLAP